MITFERFEKNINLLNLAYMCGNDEIASKIIIGLQKYFPKDQKGFCEIEHYCFDNNFGKPTTESEYDTIENLYNKLLENEAKRPPKYRL